MTIREFERDHSSDDTVSSFVKEIFINLINAEKLEMLMNAKPDIFYTRLLNVTDFYKECNKKISKEALMDVLTALIRLWERTFQYLSNLRNSLDLLHDQ